MKDEDLWRGLAAARAIYGNGEGLAIAEDMGCCYFCGPDTPRDRCTIDHRPQIDQLLKENLANELAKLGLELLPGETEEAGTCEVD